jgi:alkylation response protein AidB-like acyl-CoA dehydrogenase
MNAAPSLFSRRSSFKLDERDIYFQLFNVLGIDKTILTTLAFQDVDKDTCVRLIDVSIGFARDYLGRSYQVADRQGCERISSSEVRVPDIYKTVWEKYKEIGLCGISAPLEYGGLGTPYVVNQAVYSVLYGADPSFCIYPGFNIGAVYLLQKYGTEEQKRNFCRPLVDATMTASMVMSEPDAGSDVGSIRTKAVREEGGRYRIQGNKIFISSGMHDLTDNIVYFVLARLEDAPSGTQGLSCFVVTKYRLNDDGSPGEYNNVGCEGVEKKMGLRGNATVQLSFGQQGPCYGALLGGSENTGLSQLMFLMNLARVATGTYALGLASSAYYSAVDYAGQRIQGTSIRGIASPKAQRLPIIEHLDVKRMLLDMKAKVEGMRSLVLKAANYLSLAMTLFGEAAEDKALRRRYEALADLLIPVVKAYCSDQAWLVCETAIQVHGGYGYISDFPVEQNCRDVKIMSIWEGTNYLQAADLVRSKLSLGKTSRSFGFLKEEIARFLEQKPLYPELAGQFDLLGAAQADIDAALANFGRWLSSGEMEQIYLMATRFMNAFGDFIVGWLLLENAAAASRAMRENDREYDANFCEGKLFSMRFFFNNTLAHLQSKLKAISTVDEDFKRIVTDNFSRPQ